MVNDNNINILHIEDNKLDAELIKNYLHQEYDYKNNYVVTHSLDLNSAHKLLKSKNQYSAIILDLGLPDGNGINNIQSIQDISPNLPIVVVTGSEDEETAAEAILQGAQECISKSYGNSQVLHRAIQSSISRKKIEIALAQKAYYDDLTGLPNRLFFENSAQTLMHHAKRWNRRDALMFIDLNKFKEMNDTYGHESGNIILVKTAQRLKKTLRQSDLIARYAGDEFVIYLNCGDAPVTEDLCEKLSKKIIHAIEQPINIGNNFISISLSIGTAIYPDAGKTFSDLLKNADRAMYKAKNNPTLNYVVINDQTS